MKKKLLSIFTMFCLLIGMLPMSVWATEGESEPTYVAQVGETKYATLAEAIADANSGDEIVLLTNVTPESLLKIDKSITLNLNEKTITATVHTDREFLGEALLELGIIEGSIGQYGLYILRYQIY